jgi:dynein cytoplasmic 1 intermediate chain
VIERALSQNDRYDITIDYTADTKRFDAEMKQDVLRNELVFFDHDRNYNRPITALDWNEQHDELFLASYAQKDDIMSLEPDGLVQVWSLFTPDRPELVFHSQSAVLTAMWHPSNPKLIVGGTTSGQIVVWDTRKKKSIPVQRTSLSDGHSFPLYGLTSMPTVKHINLLISTSTDGRLCVWDDNDLVQPKTTFNLKYNERQASSHAAALAAASASAASGTPIKHKKVEIVPTTVAFRDTKSVILGSDEGMLYDVNLYDNQPVIEDDIKGGGIDDKRELSYTALDDHMGWMAHDGPITNVNFHPGYAGASRDVKGLLLTSSYDWTVKLWNVQKKQCLFTFESTRDYVYDTQWSPVHPALFASGDGTGSVDLWNLNVRTDAPLHRVKAAKKADGKDYGVDRAVSKVRWSRDGTKLAVGDSGGITRVFEVAPDVAKPTDQEAADFGAMIHEKCQAT